jgi:hypothetical protein
MAELASGGRAGGRPQPEVLSPAMLLSEALSLIRQHLPLTVYFWLGYSTLLAAAQMAGRALGVSMTPTTLSSGFVAYELATGVLSAVAGALILRLFLEGRERWLRFDRRFLECVAILVLGTLASVAITVLTFARAGDAASVAAQRLGGSLVNLALLYVMAKLALWPVGRLVGVAMTPARAWGLMRRTVRSLVLLYLMLGIVLAIPWFIGLAIFGLQSLQNPPPAFLVAASYVGGALTLVGQGVIVAIYRRRVGESRDFADVFD